MDDCDHANLVVERDGEYYRERCPDCGWVREVDETFGEP